MSAGTVIRGTLLVEDLMPAFIEEADARLEALTFEPGADLPERVKFYGRAQRLLGEVEGKIGTMSGDTPYRHTEEALHDLEALSDLLNDLAPLGMYFGAHEGDGSDFGYWYADNFEVAR